MRTPPLRWEEIALPDGDVLDLAWVDRPIAHDAPTALVLHGLAGSVESPHVTGLVRALSDRGYRTAAFHFRGCGRGPNRSPIGYHNGKTDDPRFVLNALRDRHAGPLVVAGFSLGANVLLKLLGEDGEGAPVDAAAAISPPLELERCADRMETGFSRLYQAVLVRELIGYIRRKERAGVPLDLTRVRGLRTFRDFDDRYTAPLHGFHDSADYYARASSRPFVPRIAVPTLVVHAKDDPFFTPHVIPTAQEIPENVRFELAARGGHVGFVEGRVPFRGRYHVDRRVPDFFDAVLAETR